MKYLSLPALVSAAVLSTLAHGNFHEDQIPLEYVRFPLSPYRDLRGEVTADSVFSGINTFARLPWVHCLTEQRDVPIDIAILGAPFDTATSYRPGARFGPDGIRRGSRRLTLYGGYNVPLEVNPFKSGARIVDCGDIPVTPYDNKLAIKQIEDGHKAILSREAFTALGNSTHGEPLSPISLDKKTHPRIITLGGDHTIVLPVLRSVYSVYGPISVIHFDSHIDTWNPNTFGGAPSAQAEYNHGTYFWWASQEGLIKNGSSIASILNFLSLTACLHGAIRTTLSSLKDYETDDSTGFKRIEAREIDAIGTDGIIKKIRETVGDNPVYLSIDIDSIDPAYAPATGTPETGGWSTRELRTILRGLDGLRIVSADIVEVAPAYDTNAELTTIAAADLLFEVMSIMVKTPLGKA